MLDPDTFWQDNEFRIDPWGEDFELPISIGELETDSTQLVHPDVEGLNGQPRQPEQLPPLPEQLIFIDGRRRLDRRLIGRNNGSMLYGAFATIGVGAVQINLNSEQNATYRDILIRRVLSFSGKIAGIPQYQVAVPDTLGSAPLIYAFNHQLVTEKEDPQSAQTKVLQLMREEEMRLARELAVLPNNLIFLDGNLFSRLEQAIGYVKTMRRQYLSRDWLWHLQSGQRTGIFSIGRGENELWSWYIRSGTQNLNLSRMGYHGLHGIVRLEMYVAGTPLDTVRRIADLTTILIPQYASHPTRDPRAPQNLIPVGALEKELGRYMGNRNIIARRIQNFLAAGGMVV